MDIAEVSKSATGLLLALGSLLGGMAALINSVRLLLRSNPDQPSRRLPARGVLIGSGVVGVVLVLASASIFAVRAIYRAPPSLSERLLEDAWTALAKGDFARAKASAQTCVADFHGAAELQQAELERDHSPTPPIGAPRGEEKEIVLQRGLLNDVATCLYVEGQAAEGLGQATDAKATYTATLRYSFARTWDPKGWFWSPTEAAAGRLQSMK